MLYIYIGCKKFSHLNFIIISLLFKGVFNMALLIHIERFGSGGDILKL